MGSIKQVLEQPNMNMSPGKHYTFTVGTSNAWHLISDEQSLIYILIAQTSYPQRAAHACLEELQHQFITKCGDKATTAKDQQLDKTCVNLMSLLCKKYNNLSEVDVLANVKNKVDTVKLVMQENVDMALQNCVKLESIEKSAEELQQQAGVFKKNAKELKDKMWWKNMKMRLIIAFVVVVILIIVIVVAYYLTNPKAASSGSTPGPSIAPTSRRMLRDLAAQIASASSASMAQFASSSSASSLTTSKFLRTV